MSDTDRPPRWIEYVRVVDLPEAIGNPKGHDDDLLDASLERFGFTEPPLVDERTGRLVAGHGRRSMALRAEAEGVATGAPPPDGLLLGPEGRWMIPVVRGWASADDDEAMAYLIASNRTTIVGGWVMPDLATALSGLHSGPGLSGIGYTPADLDLILAAVSQAGPTDPDAEWGDDLPDFEQGDKASAGTVTVHFPTLEDRAAFFVHMGVAPAKAFWWPAHDGHIGVDGTHAYVIADG